MRERPFPVAEFEARVDRARRSVADNRWDGLIVVGRGGGTVDRLGQLWYLTDAYPSFPTIPDLPGVWYDRGYAAAVIGSDKVVVCGDGVSLAEGGAVADTVKLGTDLPQLIADTLSELGLSSATLGLAGADALTWRQAHRLESLAPALTLRDADELLLAQRMFKSEAEIAMMRRAARIGATAMRAAMNSAAAGVTEAACASAAIAELVAAGASLANAFGITFGPDADDPRKRVPTYDATRLLQRGDMVTFDVSGSVDGYFFDLARSRTVGAEPTGAQQRSLDLVADTVNAVVAELVPGRAIAAAAKVGVDLLAQRGYSDLTADRFQAMGHGLGLGFEPPWVRSDSDLTVEVGMCIAIEKFCAIDGTGATFERTVEITEDGPVDLEPLNDTW